MKERAWVQGYDNYVYSTSQENVEPQGEPDRYVHLQVATASTCTCINGTNVAHALAGKQTTMCTCSLNSSLTTASLRIYQ